MSFEPGGPPGTGMPVGPAELSPNGSFYGPCHALRGSDTHAGSVSIDSAFGGKASSPKFMNSTRGLQQQPPDTSLGVHRKIVRITSSGDTTMMRQSTRALKAARVPFKYVVISGLFFYLAILSPIQTGAIEMKAGTAKTVITPDKAARINDISARVLTLHDGAARLVIVTYDLHSLEMATRILRKRCVRELGIDPSHLLLIATHSHQAPLGRLPENFPYQKWLANRIFAAIKEAIAKEQGPVRVFFGWGYGYFVRASGNAPTDYENQLLKVMREEQVVAMLFNQPTHLIRSSRTRKIGTEHPGYAMDEVERKLPGALAMYGDACGGNQWQTIPEAGTDNLTLWYDMHPEGRLSRTLPSKYADTLEKLAQIRGRELAHVVLKITGGPMQEITGRITSKMESIPLPLAPPLPYEEARRLAADKNIPLDIGFVCHRDRSSNWIRSLLKHHEERIPFPTKTTDLVLTDYGFLSHGSVTAPEFDELSETEFMIRPEEVIAARIGPMPLVAMQGEVCGPIGMRIKDAFRTEIPIMVFGYMGTHNIYIPTREVVRLDTYQAKTIQLQYGSPCGWAPEVEDEMVKGVVRLVRSVLEEKAGTHGPRRMRHHGPRSRTGRHAVFSRVIQAMN